MPFIRLIAIFISIFAMFLTVQPTSAQQNFRGGDPGDLQQFRVVPNNQIFNQDRELRCVEIRDTQSTGSRTCTYQCENGNFYTREQSRTEFCASTLEVTQREISRQASGVAAERCQLKRLRLTSADKICIYDCSGQTVTQSIGTTQICDRNLRR